MTTTVVERHEPIPPTPLRLYTVQRTELTELGVEDPQDVSELVQKSPAAAASGQVLKMLRLIPQVNQTAQLSGRTEILKPTNHMLAAYADLPALVPTNQALFGDFIDRLYWIFYEGAGKDNLRYLKLHDGPFEDTDCQVIWDIKTLRNKWCRHDLEHGSPSDIKGSYRTLKNTLQRFGLKQLPDSAKDYRRIHLMLVNELIQLLQKLLEKLA